MSACTVGYIIINRVNKKKQSFSMIIFIEFVLPAWPPTVMPMHFQLASCIYSHHICLFQCLVFINVKIKKKQKNCWPQQFSMWKKKHKNRNITFPFHIVYFSPFKDGLFLNSQIDGLLRFSAKKKKTKFFSFLVQSAQHFQFGTTNHCWHNISQWYFSFSRLRKPWLS